MYDNLNLAISMPVKSEDESMAVLEANYKISNEVSDVVAIMVIDCIIGKVYKLDVLDWNIKWQKFFL